MHCSPALQVNKRPSIINSILVVIFKYFWVMKYFSVIERDALQAWILFPTGLNCNLSHSTCAVEYTTESWTCEFRAATKNNLKDNFLSCRKTVNV